MYKYDMWAGKMVHVVTSLAPKPSALGFIPASHLMEGENQLLQAVP